MRSRRIEKRFASIPITAKRENRCRGRRRESSFAGSSKQKGKEKKALLLGGAYPHNRESRIPAALRKTTLLTNRGSMTAEDAVEFATHCRLAHTLLAYLGGEEKLCRDHCARRTLLSSLLSCSSFSVWFSKPSWEPKRGKGSATASAGI